jgi:putative acetyltransferase
VCLVLALDRQMQALYPAESNHLLDLASLSGPKVRFYVARLEGLAVGCGAVVLRDGFAEVKRMYVSPDVRGRGLGRRLFEALIAAARAEGMALVRLETGILSAEALALYRSMGFVERGPFGEYRPDPLSVFMERRL